MDGEVITAMRTAAASAVATNVRNQLNNVNAAFSHNEISYAYEF